MHDGPDDPKNPPDQPPNVISIKMLPARVPSVQARVDAAGAGAKPFELLWFHDIQPVTKAKDFVQGVLIEGSAAVIYGEPGSGKTFWATDLALYVATGKWWNNRRVKQGGVVYCVLEGGDGFRNRVSAWRSAHKPGIDMPFAAIQSGVNLLDPDADTTRLIAAIKEAGSKCGQPVKLVVIDTLSRALAGGNENTSEDMGSLVMNMDRIRAETGACVLFIHHCGKDAARGARGHSLLLAAIDTELEVTVDKDTEDRVATVGKQRDLPKGARFGFRLETAHVGENEHGEAVETCITRPNIGVRTGKSDKPLTDEERGCLAEIAAYFSDESRTHRVAPTPGTGEIPCATRAEIRRWLVRHGRLGVADSVATDAPPSALSNSDRSKLARVLNNLKDHKKICIFDNWVWLAGAGTTTRI